MVKRPFIVADPPEVFGEVILDITGGSGRSVKDGLVDAVIDALSEEGLLPPDDGDSQVTLCIDEAVVNAMEHGNGFDPQKKVRVRAFVEPGRWGVLVEDEGGGFAESEIPSGTDAELGHGRGVLLMRTFMDGMQYYCGGSAVLLEKKR